MGCQRSRLELELGRQRAMDEESLAGANASTSSAPSDADSWQATASAIAKEAASLYKSKSYTECLTLLQQLLVKTESDPKVLLNVALTEFHRDGCTDYNKLLDLLKRLKMQCEDLARAADDQVAKTSESVGYIDEYDSSIPVLNIATVHYHLQEFRKALEVLEPLFSNIEPVDEDSAKQICLLMLDVALGLRQPAKAAAVIRYMEKSYGLTHNSTLESTGSLQPQATPQTPAAANNSLEGRSLTIGIRPTAMPASLVSSPGADNSLAQGPGEETFEEDALSIGLELDGTPSSRSSALPARLPEKSSPAPADKLFLHLYKVRFLILTRNLKAAKREVKAALNLSKDNMTALLLKAQLEYLRGNYPKALKLLANCNNINKEPAIEPMIHSNLGCVYHKMRKGQSATQFFVSALRKYNGFNRKTRTKTLWTISQDKSCAVYYNVGLQKLLSGDPVLAASLFQDAAYTYQSKPIYWIRLAECCLSALELGLLQDARSPRKDKLEAVLVGESMWRRLVLPSGSMNPAVKDLTQQGSQDAETQGKEPLLSLPFAKKCLRRAYFLLTSASKAAQDEQVARQEVSVAAEDVTAGEDAAIPNTPPPPSTTTGNFDAGLTAFDAEVKKEKALLESWILVAWAFVELCLGDPKAALLCASTLLEQPDISWIYRCLGQIYAAEALCFLGRLKEAEEQLRSCLRNWMDASAVESTGQADVTEEDFAKLTGLQARASLYVNLAAVNAMQGNLDQAQNAGRQALAFAPGSTMAVLAMVYVDLVEGRSKEALDRLKAFRHTSVSKLQI